MGKRKGKKERSTVTAAPDPSSKAPALQNRRTLAWPAAALVLLLATFTAYWPVVHAGFVFDDEVLVTGNPCTTASDGIYRIWFTTDNFEYLPFTYSAFWLEYQLWGQKALGYHLVSLGLHAINVLLLWLLLGRLAIPGAWWGALIFAVHPVAVSSVAWISEQKNLWGLLFGLTSLLLYLKFETSGRRGWYWYALSLAAFVVALLGKTSVVMLPFLLLFYRWRRTGRPRLVDFAWTVPFFLASLVLGLVTIWFQEHRAIADYKIPIGNLLERLFAAGYIVWFYLGKALVPTHLSVIYSNWDFARLQLWPTAALIALLAVLWQFRHSGRWGQACWLGFGAYMLILTPVLGFVPMSFMRYSLVADHFQYPALPALATLAGALIAGATETGRSRSATSAIVTACCLVIVVGLAALTWQQAAAYKDALTLWSDAIANDPNSTSSHYNLGVALEGRTQVDAAIDHYRKALKIKPDFLEAHNNLGTIMARRGQTDEAIEHFRKAVEIKPENAEFHNNLANALAARGQVDEAIEHYRKALEIMPDLLAAHYNLANALAGRERLNEALEHYQKALELAVARNDMSLVNAIRAQMQTVGRVDR